VVLEVHEVFDRWYRVERALWEPHGALRDLLEWEEVPPEYVEPLAPVAQRLERLSRLAYYNPAQTTRTRTGP
jgi:hypothetical protein